MKFNKSLDWLKESDEDDNLLADDELDTVEEEMNEGLYVDPSNYDKHDDLVDVVDKQGNAQKMTQATYDKNKDSGEFEKKEPEEKEEENFKTVEDIAGIKEDELNEWLEDNIDFSADSDFNAKQIAKKIPALKSHEKELADAIDKYSGDYTVDMPLTYAIQTTLSKTRNSQTSDPKEKPKEKEQSSSNTKSFNKDTARDYAKEFYRSIYGPNKDDSPYKDKTLDYSGDLRNIENWPTTVNDIFDHQHNLLSTLYVQDQHASNDEESKKFREQYNTVFDDADKALKNVDKKERFGLIDDYYHNRYKQGGVTDDMDGYRTKEVKRILQSFGYDVSGKKDMRAAYKDLKQKLG